MFATKNGFIKLVSGAEFETNRAVVATTKLEDGDSIVGITCMSAGDILKGNNRVILITEAGLSLAFPLEDVPELKKVSRGVKAITLEKKDKVGFAIAVTAKDEVFNYNGKLLPVKKFRMKRRTAKGSKTVLE